MAPKVKFTREEMIAAAVEITKEAGLQAITARAVGQRLGISSRPLFTAFQNMEELQQAVREAAKKCYNGYVQAGLSQPSAFRGVGMQYIRFAAEEPKLFQLLFMSEQEVVPGVMGVLPVIDENYPRILDSVQKDFGLGQVSEAEELYRHLWIFTHGIATLSATGMCRFSEDEISRMLRTVRIGLLAEKKAEGAV